MSHQAAAPLFQAIAAGDIEGVRRLVSQDPALAGARDPAGVSAVLQARYRNRPDIEEVLLAAHPALDVFDAAGVGRVDRLVELLDADPELVDPVSADGFTPLHLAAFFGDFDAVTLLLERGARVEMVSANDMHVQALHAAVAGGHAEVAALLLQHGADPDARQAGGWTPLMAAAVSGDELAVEVLLKAGADAAAQSDDGHDAATLAREKGHAALVERLVGTAPA